MKVKELLRQYRLADKVRDGGINFLKEHITTTYIPYMEKMSACELLLKTCWYRTNPETGVKRLLVNSPNLRLMYTMEIVRRYTDIELQYDGTKLTQDYDDLRKTGIINEILSLIPKAELDEFGYVLQMTKNDIMTNEYEVGAYIANRFENGVAIIKELIVPALEKAGLSMDDLGTLLSSLSSFQEKEL